MKRNILITLSTLLLLTVSFASIAGAPKYASVNVYFGGLRGAKIFVIADGKVETIKCESGFTDQEAGELAVFAPLQTQLEKLAESGYKLQSTTSLAPALMVYTLVKE